MAKQSETSFEVNDEVFYQSHGPGAIVNIEEQVTAGVKLVFYVIRFEQEKLTMHIPTRTAIANGLRKVTSYEMLDEALQILKRNVHTEKAPWYRRSKEYEQKINSGDLTYVAEVIRDLHPDTRDSPMSPSLRELYEKALSRLLREVCCIIEKDLDETAKFLTDQTKIRFTVPRNHSTAPSLGGAKETALLIGESIRRELLSDKIGAGDTLTTAYERTLASRVESNVLVVAPTPREVLLPKIVTRAKTFEKPSTPTTVSAKETPLPQKETRKLKKEPVEIRRRAPAQPTPFVISTPTAEALATISEAEREASAQARNRVLEEIAKEELRKIEKRLAKKKKKKR